MKIFESKPKINFVDENNVVVGFDLDQECCENFGYFINDALDENISCKELEAKSEGFYYDDKTLNKTLNGFVFDKDFFKETRGIKESVLDLEEDNDKSTAVAIFRLVNKNDQKIEKFIYLFNHHNGYYSHGFNMDVGGITVKSGKL